jgi:omega-amidase
MRHLAVGCIQPRLQGTVAECFERVEMLLMKAKDQNLSIIILPEQWLPFAFSQDTSKYVFEEDAEPVHFLQQCAEKYRVCIVGGGMWQYIKNKPKIVSYVISPNGSIAGRQEKLHLYAMEKHFFSPGTDLCLFQLGEVNFAVLICFDISFFETPSLAVHQGADLLISPTLIRREGMENWNIYLRARALENRVPVIACNTLGEVMGSQYMGCSQIIQFYPGHTLPSKLKISTVPENTETLIHDWIDYKFPRGMRKERLSERIDTGSLKITHNRILDK